jgi:hypothetical protein
MGKKIILDLATRNLNAFGFVSKNKSNNLNQTDFADKTGLSNATVYVNNNISFEDITLSGNGYNLEFAYKGFSKDGGLGNVFAPPPMVSFRKSKNISRTEIDGTDAEVVERYGDRSWEITIQGLLIDMVNHEYPSEQVKKIRELIEVAAPFEVSGQAFDDLGIKSIYVTDFEIAGVQGFQDTMQYSISARSIKPVEFFLNNRF